MTRQEVLAHYEVGGDGMIESPGKFEGEMVYMPHFWDIYLDGCAHVNSGDTLWVEVTPGDKAEFPELGKMKGVEFYLRDDGFVCEV